MMINKDGPIPGENFTSDTKNYPWHQPPEFANVTDALENMSKKLTSPQVGLSILSFADAGFPLARITQMIVMEGVAQGKWTVDMGLLLAGPFCKIIEIMCDSYDINYNLGIEENQGFNTGTFFKGQVDLMKETNKKTNLYEIVKEELPEIQEAASEQGPAPESKEQGASTEKDLGDQGFAEMTSAPTEEE